MSGRGPLDGRGPPDGPARHLTGEAELLRVFFGESDRVRGHPAHEALLHAAQRAGLAGATLLRGSLGFGADSVLHQPRPFRLSGDLPMVLEVIDEPARIERFVQQLEELLTGGGLVTLERVTVLRAGGGPASSGAGQP